MMVRFFGGFDFVPDDARSPDLAAVGYAKGVPNGRRHCPPPASADAAPTFLVAASRAPSIRILTASRSSNWGRSRPGRIVERIHDVAVSDGRTIDPDGRYRTPVGNTVDVDAASYDNTIGAASLTAVWRDPDFDPRHRQPTTCASSRSPRRDGPPTTPRVSALPPRVRAGIRAGTRLHFAHLVSADARRRILSLSWHEVACDFGRPVGTAHRDPAPGQTGLPACASTRLVRAPARGMRNRGAPGWRHADEPPAPAARHAICRRYGTWKGRRGREPPEAGLCPVSDRRDRCTPSRS